MYYFLIAAVNKHVDYFVLHCGIS